ncbi:helix-turn-helix domain-containing protein [Amycolatopsis palatopharyngis]|uniref:helix-turn-helix domain-containing protein n=1 Tax=Amycolatopsis palatopharyngis TaxID=187982 RepID=UPI001FE50996|nr:helix-turn-helix transcriptional regulator [Amycolatopsis palatopharyngis]
MGEPRKPNFRMRQLARTLRRLREQARLTQEETARRLRLSEAKLSRIEHGQLPNYHEFLAMLDLYGVIVSDYDEYVRMYDRAEERGWWHAYGMDDRGFVSIEAEASVVRTYEVGHVPGLLQTESYTRATFASARVPLTGQQLENQVTVRLRRQRRLVEEPLLHVHVVMDEAVLHKPTCDHDQLTKIGHDSHLPNMIVQVIPEQVGVHGGLYSNFLVVGFPQAAEPDLAYVEYGFGSLQIEKESDVRAARLLFEHLASVALDERESRKLIERIAAE